MLNQGLGDTVLVDDGSGLQGVAACHIGARTEAGGGNCYVKFACVRPGPRAARHSSGQDDRLTVEWTAEL